MVSRLALKQTATELKVRKDRIVIAASDVFLRYGHARTTMGDIAEKAGISRPALYVVFPHKDDIFAAVIARLTEDTLAQFRAALPRLRSLERRLHFCCERWAGDGYDLTEAHPDARDVFHLGFPPVRAMYAEIADFLADLMREAVTASRLKTTPEQLAWVLLFAMRGLKDMAEDGDHMRRLIAVEVDVVLAALKGR